MNNTSPTLSFLDARVLAALLTGLLGAASATAQFPPPANQILSHRDGKTAHERLGSQIVVTPTHQVITQGGASIGDVLIRDKRTAQARTVRPHPWQPVEFACDLGDLTGDGIHEIGLGYPQWNQGAGELYAFDPLTGALVWSVGGQTPGEGLGTSASRAGDLNSDGRGDVIVGAPYGNAFGGRVRALDGRTGSMIWDVIGTGGEQLGISCDGTADISGDGVNDVLIGATAYSPTPGFTPGRVHVRDGRNGSLLGQIVGTAHQGGTGAHVRWIGDQTGDGFAEAAGSAPFAPWNGLASAGTFTIVDLRRQTVILHVGGTRTGESLGKHIDETPDVDGDGRREIGVSALGPNGEGSLTFYSNRNGAGSWSIPRTWIGRNADDRLGQSFAFDDYPKASLVVSVPGSDSNGLLNNGAVYQLVEDDLSYFADTFEISATTGGTQNLTIALGAHSANHIYLVAASLSGTAGFALGGVVVPLTLDALTLLGAQAPNALFTNGLGVLDAAGGASAGFTAPRMSYRFLIGREMNTAVLTIHPGTLTFEAVTNPLPTFFF